MATISTTANTPTPQQLDFMRKLHLFDNTMGYRFGQLVWLSFWIPSLVVLFCDNTPGPDRDFLTQATLMSSLTILYYSFHQDKGSPASTPGNHALFGELLARWVLFAHHVPSLVVNNSTIGVMNWVQIICMAVFTLTKLPTSIYTNWNQRTYKQVVKQLQDEDKVY